MKRTILLLVALAFGVLNSFSQFGQPSLKDIFYQYISQYEEDEPEIRVYFSREREGWFVRKLHYQAKEDTVARSPFWLTAEKRYRELPFSRKNSAALPEDAAQKFSDYEFAYGNLYAFQRCIYFGYPEWTKDIIHDFGNSVPNNDTLAESLARAYSSEAMKYVYSEWEWATKITNPLQSRLPNGEIPSDERIRKFMELESKSKDVYEIIAQRNPGYQTMVGSAATKLFNEQLHTAYILLRMEKKSWAMEIINKIQPDSLAIKTGMNYLGGTAKNAILFTDGDNDTYQPLYVQLRYGYRTDVTILNTSLLGAPGFLAWLKQHPEFVRLSLPASFFNNDQNSYALYQPPSGKKAASMTLKKLLDHIVSGKERMEGNGGVITYPVRDVSLNVNGNATSGLFPSSIAGNLIIFNLKTIITLADLAVLDIIEQNIQTRPVYFSSLNSDHPAQADFIVTEGKCHRLMPVKIPVPSKQVNAYSIAKTTEYINKFYQPDVDPLAPYENLENNANTDHHVSLYLSICQYYINQKNIPEARKWMNRCLSVFKAGKINTFRATPNLVWMLLLLEEKQKAKKTAEYFCTQALKTLTLSLASPSDKRKQLLYPLKMIKTQFDNKNVVSEIINNAVEQLEEEE